MIGASMNQAATCLRRGFLLVGLLAIVAGFLGMHIMIGLHGTHAMASAVSSMEPAGASFETAHSIPSHHPAAHSLQTGATAHDSLAPGPMITAGAELTGNSRTAVASASCVCQSSCTDPASMHSACVPSAAAASLAAPPPGMAPTSIHNPDHRGDGPVRAYSYLPASPSPGDLSISRT